LANVKHIMQLFNEYGQYSGQIINVAKVSFTLVLSLSL
jgi:hypothetical protein